ncbi:hypothetical protein J7E95_33725, partial [Streptomyces sp. ISL-14]|nr:hypothetical protein [Streptomyces sp. ISL-14]
MAAGRDIAVAVTGDNNNVHLVAPVRSAYLEHVRQNAPDELPGRERELAELAAFCGTDSEPAHLWLKGDAWAGKSALSAWFALHPPPGVRVVAFFVTARHGGHNHAAAYVDNALEQLAELAGESLPGHLTPATRDGHLLRLYREAARACARRGERLVLLVDGLDEDRGVTTGPGTHSIASLLPARPEAGMRVLVTGRPNPPLPADVPANHPLRDPAIQRRLDPSPYAEVVRAEAERELDQLLHARGPERDLLALVTAAGGGLTAEDLAELTGVVPYRVRRTLASRAGRTFSRRTHAYLLAHEALQARAREMLGDAELARCRDRLHRWGDEWRARGWPTETPEYLLHSYFRRLVETGDTARVLRCALDAGRHERMLAVTGVVSGALEEIDAAERMLAEAMGEGRARGDVGAETEGPADGVLTMLRLRLHREDVRRRGSGSSETLAWAWAALGQPSRAEAVAGSLSPLSSVVALALTARELADQGSTERAVEVAEAAEAGLRELVGPARGEAMVAVHRALAGAGLRERADALPGDCCGPWAREHLTPRIVQTWVEEDEFERARSVALRQTRPSCRNACLSTLVGALVSRGRIAPAWDIVRDAGEDVPAPAALRLALALARAGRTQDAEQVWGGVRLRFLDDGMALDEAAAEGQGILHALADADRLDVVLDLLSGDGTRVPDLTVDLVATALVRQGELDRAEAMLTGVSDETAGEAARLLARTLARRGELGRVRRFARSLVAAKARSQVLAAAAEDCAATGRLREAESLVTGSDQDSLDALARGAVAWARAGQHREAEHFLIRVEDRIRRTVAARDVVWSRVVVARELAAAGRPAAAREVLFGIENALERAGSSDTEPYTHGVRLMEAAVALAMAGEPGRADALLSSLDRPGGGRPEAWAALLRAHIEDGGYDRAEELLSEARGGHRDELLAEAAVAFAERGESVRAVECARALRHGPARLSAMARTARALTGRAMGDAARGLMASLPDGAGSVVPGPESPTALDLAEVFQAWSALDEPDRAHEVANRAMRLPGATDATTVWRLVRALVRAGLHDEAKWFVRRRLPPGDTQDSARETLAAALAEAGDTAAALNWIRPLEHYC